MQNFTLDDFINPTTNSISQFIMDIFGCLHAIMAVFAVCVVLKNSIMGFYRFYLLNSIFWNAFYMGIIATISPIWCGAYPMLIINSHLEEYFSTEIWLYFWNIGAVFVFNTGFALLMQILYRIIYFFNLPFYYPILEKIDQPKFFLCWVGSFQLFTIPIFFYMSQKGHGAISWQNYEEITENAPVLEEVFKTRKIIGNLLIIRMYF